MRPRLSKRRIWLREWSSTEIELTLSELAELRRVPARLVIEPLGSAGRFRITPRQIVGTASTPNLDVLIQPKLDVQRVFYLLGFAEQSPFLRDLVPVSAERGLGEAMIGAYTAALGASLRRGLLSDYVHHEESGLVIRGRVRYREQVARRFGRALPVEIEYDDYTVDTPANRLLRAALDRCLRFRVHGTDLRRRIRDLAGHFAQVRTTPAAELGVLPHPTRLNRRYQAAYRLAALILAGQSAELDDGGEPVPSFLIDMDRLFEDFVFHALGRRLRTLGMAQGQWRRGEVIPLDTLRRLRNQPDLSLWKHRACAFVGDAKHKHTTHGELADVYQLLAYCASTGLRNGTLIYADGPTDLVQHQVVRGGPVVQVVGVNIADPVSEIETRLDELAVMIWDQATGVRVA